VIDSKGLAHFFSVVKGRRTISVRYNKNMGRWKYLTGRFQCRTDDIGRFITWDQKRSVLHGWLDLGFGGVVGGGWVFLEKNQEGCKRVTTRGSVGRYIDV
jgi:hypothetical protein